MPTDPSTSPTVNLVIVRGTASGPPELRQLASGRRLATFAVRTHGLVPPATSAPVAVWDPPGWLETLEPGDEVIVAGCVRRRFYRAKSGALAARGARGSDRGSGFGPSQAPKGASARRDRIRNAWVTSSARSGRAYKPHRAANL